MNGKFITKDQIDALPNYMLPIDGGDGDYNFTKYTDILALYDNAPSVGGEPVAWVSHSTAEYFNKVAGVGIFEYTSHDEFKVPLYTTPQPDRVAELESTIKSYDEFLANGEPKKYRAKISELEAKLKEYEQAIKAMVKDGWLSCGVEGLSEPQQKVYDLYQAMKG